MRVATLLILVLATESSAHPQYILRRKSPSKKSGSIKNIQKKERRNRALAYENCGKAGKGGKSGGGKGGRRRLCDCADGGCEQEDADPYDDPIDPPLDSADPPIASPTLDDNSQETGPDDPPTLPPTLSPTSPPTLPPTLSPTSPPTLPPSSPPTAFVADLERLGDDSGSNQSIDVELEYDQYVPSGSNDNEDADSTVRTGDMDEETTGTAISFGGGATTLEDPVPSPSPVEDSPSNDV